MNTLALFDSSGSSRLCLVLLHSLWQVALLAMIVWIIQRWVVKKSIEWSYALHVGALVLGLAAVPITYVSLSTATPTRATINSIGPNSDATPLIADRVSRAKDTGIQEHADRYRAANAEARPQVTAGIETQMMALWGRMSPWLTALYLGGVMLMLTRLLASMFRAERLRAVAKPITDGPLVEKLGELCRNWAVRSVPLLAEAEEILIPKVIGLVRPTILLPIAAISGFSTSELEMILAHEVAHVRRHDMWINLLQRLAEVALFFNPALWYLSRRIASLREYCCDEMTCRAVSTSESELRLRYAGALLRIVELSNSKAVKYGQLTAMAASGRSPSELRRRVARLFGEPLREPLPFSRSGALFFAIVAVVFVCGPMVWPSRALSTDDATKKTSETESASATAAKKFDIRSKLEIVALGTHDENPQRWWDGDGNMLESVPFKWEKEGMVSSGDSQWRRIAFRIQDLPDDADITYSVKGANASAGARLVIDGQRRPRGYFAQYFGTDDEQRTVELRVGIAAGPWKTDAKIDASHLEATGQRNGKSIVSSGGFWTKEGTSDVVISHNYFDTNHRVVAIDKQGQTHVSISSGGASAGKIYQIRPSFPGIRPEEIDHFEFQTRDYEWASIKDLPLKPGGAGQR